MATVPPSDHSSGTPNAAETADNRVSAGQGGVPAPLRDLADLLARSPHNLVARNERETVLERHVLEGDALADLLAPKGRWMDLGTGGGLPGLVLAWRYPEVEWTLVDATAKKVEAVREFARALGLDNVDAVQARAEALAHEPAHRGGYNGVVARALAPLPTLVELARGFVAAGGDLVAVKGPGWRAEVDAAAGAFRQLGLAVVSTEALAGAVRATWVVTMRAQGPPPAGFPRRDGLPKHDPLR